MSRPAALASLPNDQLADLILVVPQLDVVAPDAPSITLRSALPDVLTLPDSAHFFHYRLLSMIFEVKPVTDNPNIVDHYRGAAFVSLDRFAVSGQMHQSCDNRWRGKGKGWIQFDGMGKPILRPVSRFPVVPSGYCLSVAIYGRFEQSSH